MRDCSAVEICFIFEALILLRKTITSLPSSVGVSFILIGLAIISSILISTKIIILFSIDNNYALEIDLSILINKKSGPIAGAAFYNLIEFGNIT